MGDEGWREVRLDLDGVAVMAAGALDQLVALHVELRGAGMRLVLLNVGPGLFEGLEAARLTLLFGVRPTGSSWAA
jgi:anti-anti-sigma regulatory factor